MDYEKAYKEALERAKKSLETAKTFDYEDEKIARDIRETVYSIFTELKDSDDEIRRELISLFQDCIDCKNHPYNASDSRRWIAWLEKQAEPQPYKGNADTMRKNLIKAFKSVGSNHWGGFNVKDILYFLESKEAVELEKQDKSNPYSGVSFEYNGHTWGMCARDNGVDILLDKQIFKHLEKQGGQKPIISDDALREGIAHFGITQYQIDNWLKKYVDIEKQGENKPADKVEPKFKVGDTVTVKPMSYQGEVFKGEPFKIVDIIEDNYVSDDGKTYSISLQDGWKLVEQEPADKVEPKFKVGDWIVYETEEWREVLQIETIESERYTFTNGSSFSFAEEQNMRFWTIQDAKDGDVLVTLPSNGSNQSKRIFIFKEITDGRYIKNAIDYYCELFNNKFMVKSEFGYMGETIDDFAPATKGERDLLFQKMKEAGYEWDADKKVLVIVGIDNDEEDERYEELMEDNETDLNIKQNPAWSEEDDAYITLISGIFNYEHRYGQFTTSGIKFFNNNIITVEQIQDWLKSLKDKVQPQTKQEWSEEDEERCMWTARLIGTARFNELESDKMPCSRSEFIKWLKSLKDRVQLHWKPTEEQMSVLYWILTYIQLERKNENIIESLYNDLKKL